MKDYVGIVTTLKAPVEDVLRFVNWHINLGVDHLFLFFDDPDDKAIPQLKGNNHLTCIRCDTAYWASLGVPRGDAHYIRQRINATHCLKMASERQLTWLFHIDIDELLFAKEGLHPALLAAGDADQIILSPMEAVPELLRGGEPFTSSRFFRVLPHPVCRGLFVFWAALLGIGRFTLNRRFINNKSFIIKGRYFNGHESGKSGSRLSKEIVEIKIHHPVFRSSDIRRYRPKDLVLLHFESYRFKEWERKMERWMGQDWSQQKRSRVLRPQLVRFKRILEQPPEMRLKLKQKLYKRFYFINPVQRFILHAMGMLQRIDLDPRLFGPPSPKKK